EEELDNEDYYSLLNQLDALGAEAGPGRSGGPGWRRPRPPATEVQVRRGGRVTPATCTPAGRRSGPHSPDPPAGGTGAGLCSSSWRLMRRVHCLRTHRRKRGPRGGYRTRP
ncbi:hypothetical protein P7K49_015349, partial [Saguinus oedipus]